MSMLRWIYLGLAIAGTIVPLVAVAPHVAANGAGPGPLIAAWKANPASTGLYYDLLISAIALNLWIVVETYVRRDYWVLLCVPATWLVGVSCGLPLFLFLRSRPVS